VASLDVGSLLADVDTYDGQPVAVTGFFITDGQVGRLCSAVAESYPPQCGEPALRLVGALPADVVDALERPTDAGMPAVAWGTLEVTGTVDATGADGGPSIDIASVRVVGA
jgi:hypothetical protein